MVIKLFVIDLFKMLDREVKTLSGILSKEVVFVFKQRGEFWFFSIHMENVT